jgi:hypothetical protein
MGIKDNVDHVMGWLETFHWPMGPCLSLELGAYGVKNQKYVFLPIFGHFWSQVGGYGGPGGYYMRSLGNRLQEAVTVIGTLMPWVKGVSGLGGGASAPKGADVL